jgi:hypothetical protein
MDLERLLSVSTLPCVETEGGLMYRADVSTGSGSSSVEAPTPHQFRVGVKIRSAAFGEGLRSRDLNVVAYFVGLST